MMEARRLAGFKAGDVCLLNHDNKLCGTYRLCRVLSANTATDSLTSRIKVGYEERRAGRKYKPGPLTEVEIDTQQLALLVATDMMELPGEPHELLKDDATGYDLKQSFSKAGLEEIEEVEDGAPDELIKDVATDNTKGDNPEGLAKDIVRDTKPQEDVIMYDATGQDLGKTGRKESSTMEDDNLKEKLTEAAAQEVVALNVHHDQQPKKRTREVRVADSTM